MHIRPIAPDLYVSGQILPEDLDHLASVGIRALVCNRPDGEAGDQPDFATLEEAARARGIATAYLPIGGEVSAEDQAPAFAEALATLPRPLLAFCRTGNRSEKVASAARARAAAGPAPSDGAIRHAVVIVGGGSAGIATAASLLKRKPGLDVAVIEPSEDHFYQPGFTMVGGGVFKPSDTLRKTREVLPRGASWIRERVTGFAPESNTVRLASGKDVIYEVLVVAMGNRLAWDKVEGLEAALGQNGVTSNYRHDLAPYTWQLVQQLAKGAGATRALFTQPPMPIKCAGAPQKAMYLACSEWEDRKALSGIEVEFHNAGGVLFGVPEYVPALMETVARYGIDLRFNSSLVAVDGKAREATFRTEAGDITRSFDMLHAVPPQEANPVIAASPLADAAGYAEVDPHTLRAPRWPNVFALGDGCSTPNAKTAAAARKQGPVVAVNVLAALDGNAPVASYDGYGSCPLTVDRGHIVLAEFTYGGKLAPTLPTWLIDGTRPSRLAWHLKADALPPIYWKGMLKGREWLVPPAPLL
ncbi:bifunctional protein tyrosine phosphatase family protein/NAD(P)/FAD-dependent oxidoreductase [Novosphingobium profundi]|uniref:bifunctional protein tyrosine phosphatase family protein/NAD(P)/FAD-dependent oxidoreductase n=1 Tax=Novosphingobium profundi TaxID=1774954 RepID=UPI001BD9EDA9|nr:bifunctional protein tyrosine phosphatase family protein/NAD(P)/FAD-dependent oxidoreductase [Novosphingobium profundi]MBT0669998.1 bifunctional protein tyrosine phosphatase family protein/NAD(P)/FAD-dependent oxidoreductase [Novosphingobium profundi]